MSQQRPAHGPGPRIRALDSPVKNAKFPRTRRVSGIVMIFDTHSSRLAAHFRLGLRSAASNIISL
jgi:hypothetical protein